MTTESFLSEASLGDVLWEFCEDMLLLCNSGGKIVRANEPARDFIGKMPVSNENGEENLFELLRAMDPELKTFSPRVLLKSKGRLHFTYHWNSQVLDLTSHPLQDNRHKNRVFLVMIKEKTRIEFDKLFINGLLTQCNDAFMLTNHDLENLKILYVNRAFEKITGYAFHEVVGKSPKILQGKDTDREVLNELEKNLAQGKDFFGNTVNYKKNGEKFINEWSISSLKDVSGESASYYMAIIRDVTDREKLKIELLRNEKKFRLLFEEHPSPVILTEPGAGRIIDMNKQALEFYGYGLVGKPYQDLIVRTGEGMEEIMIHKTFRGNAFVRENVNSIHHEGQDLEIHLIHDVTSQKEAEIRLEQIVKSTTNEIYIFETDTLNLVFMNNSACVNLGYNKDEVKRLNLSNVIPDYTLKRFRNEVLVPLSKGHRKGKSKQFQHRRKDGSCYDVESTIQLMTLNDQESVVLIANDVTISKRDKTRRNLINTINEAILSSRSKKNCIDEVLATVCDLLGFDGGELWVNTEKRSMTRTNLWSRDHRMNEFLKVAPAIRKEGSWFKSKKNPEAHYFENFDADFLCGIERKHAQDVTSVVTISLEAERRYYGTMVFYAFAQNNYINEYLNVLSIVGNQVSQFLTNKHIEEKLIRSSREKEILLREIHHRVKNNLQTVSSLLYLKSYEIKDKELLRFFMDTQNRIAAISYTHEKLLQGQQYRVLDIKPYLEDLIQNVYYSFDTLAEKVRIIKNIEPVTLPTDIVMHCGLIINELMTNAMQHAFQGKPGILKIGFYKRNHSCYLLVEDNGMGNFISKSRESLGLQLVDMFVEQINGQLEKRIDGGTKYKIEFEVIHA